MDSRLTITWIFPLQCSINAVIGNLKSAKFPLSGYATYRIQRCAMTGRRLNRKAITCSAAISRTVAVADHGPTPVLRRKALKIPTAEANPTIIVIAISVGEKVPETIRVQPSRDSQMKIISISQKKKHGSAAHLIQPERQMPRTMAIQSGDVCTMCRRTPCDTAPTTSKAATTETQQTVKMR
jgi:hypothetical protein